MTMIIGILFQCDPGFFKFCYHIGTGTDHCLRRFPEGIPCLPDTLFTQNAAGRGCQLVDIAGKRNRQRYFQVLIVQDPDPFQGIRLSFHHSLCAQDHIREVSLFTVRQGQHACKCKSHI